MTKPTRAQLSDLGLQNFEMSVAVTQLLLKAQAVLDLSQQATTDLHVDEPVPESVPITIKVAKEYVDRALQLAGL